MSNTGAHLRKITLHLARDKDFPAGSSRHGYEFVAPLDDASHIDLAGWKERRALCSARRFWGSEPTLHGRLAHHPGGAHGATWAFDYDADAGADEEAGIHFGDHAFAPGEYVSIRDANGVVRTFKVASVANF